MGVQSWNPERFESELTARLTAALGSGPGPADLTAALAECAAAAETACRGRPLDCGPGCPHCCVLNVAILLPEGLAIANWLRNHLPPDQLFSLQESLASFSRWVRWMDDAERIVKQVSCPLLDGAGNCSIHPVRPLVCRGAASLDRAECRRAFAPVLTDQVRAVPADLQRLGAYDGVFAALGRSLRHHALDHRSIELAAGVLAFLERPSLGEVLCSGGRLPDRLWE